MQVGDLIYCEHDDEYGVFLDEGLFTDWITILSEGEIMQVQAHYWIKAE